tara:strand:+ start:6318 stop:7625 length:1308 start_codon:yes stop_codon:yes gene_type:complete
MKKSPKVYVGMSIDILHHGHINILEKASEFGKVIVGLLSDKAISTGKRMPLLTFEQRKKIVANLKNVSEIVIQDEWDYSKNLIKYKPDYMIHGDDWLSGPLAPFRELAIKALNTYGGKLIEIPYTKGISSTKLIENFKEVGTTPDMRRSSLKRLIAAKDIVRIIESHSPLSALIGEKVNAYVGNKFREFDGFWSSSLTDSTQMGKPDIEALDISKRLENINNIFDVTTKPLIMDADTGGKVEHFNLNIRSIERLGISAVIIEDKKGLKKNSLLGNDVEQIQENIDLFSEKIFSAKKNVVSEDFMIIARVESLILDKGVNDALKRSFAYVESGADGIMIHSRKKSPYEVFNFSLEFRKEFPYIPLVVVPTSFNNVTEEELIKNGFNIVIYANHLLRAAYPSMKKVAEKILIDSCAFGVDKDIISISEILDLIPGTS